MIVQSFSFSTTIFAKQVVTCTHLAGYCPLVVLNSKTKYDKFDNFEWCETLPLTMMDLTLQSIWLRLRFPQQLWCHRTWNAGGWLGVKRSDVLMGGVFSYPLSLVLLSRLSLFLHYINGILIHSLFEFPHCKASIHYLIPLPNQSPTFNSEKQAIVVFENINGVNTSYLCIRLCLYQDGIIWFWPGLPLRFAGMLAV